MNTFKLRVVILALSVTGLAVAFGSLLWLNRPRAGYGIGEDRVLEGLNRFGAVPDFSLTERSGNTAALAGLRGKVWVADFIYTSCTDTCPLQSAEMAKLQKQWQNEPDFRLVSFSVDPARDTPEALARYADHFSADPHRWLFLTGKKRQLSRLVEEGFRLSAAPAIDSAAEADVILHSSRFVLIDRQAQIRGYYDSRDTAALQRMNKDILTLVRNEKE